MADVVVKLSSKNIKTLYRWFSVMRHEVDISDSDINLFKRIIEPNLEEDFKGVVKDIHKQYKEQ